MGRNTDYKAFVQEIHHTQKLDKPSGTAITIAEQILQNHPLYEKWNLVDENTDSISVSIEAIREKNIPGTHAVSYENNIV